MDAAEKLLQELQAQIGSELAVGEWLAVDQERIDAFAQATGDVQWIHCDPARAKTESPYGSTVAHGFLTLSLLPLLTKSNAPGEFQKHYPGMRLRVNYGLEKVRFPAPVRAGDRIRARTELLAAERVGDGVQIGYRLTVEIAGQEKPACVAVQLVRVYP